MTASLSMTYREATQKPRQKKPILQVHLAGAPLHVQRAIASVRIAAALVAGWAFFQPWHVVRPLQGGFEDAFCWAPDRHNTSFSTSQPTYGPEYTHTGWSHAHTTLPLVLLAVIVALSLVPFRRPRMLVTLGVLAALLVAGIALFYALFDLQHLFDHVEILTGSRIFNTTLSVISLTWLADVLSTPFLYLWARSRLL